MAENKITVFIYLPGEPVAVPAGIFTYEGDLQIGTFAYGQKYPERKNALRTTTPGTTDFFSVLPEWRCPRPMTSCRL